MQWLAEADEWPLDVSPEEACVEVALGVYFTLITAIAFYHGHLVPCFFLSLFMIGFYWAGIASLLPSKARAAQVPLKAPSEAGA